VDRYVYGWRLTVDHGTHWRSSLWTAVPTPQPGVCPCLRVVGERQAEVATPNDSLGEAALFKGLGSSKKPTRSSRRTMRTFQIPQFRRVTGLSWQDWTI
jgi:hypothetical protein